MIQETNNYSYEKDIRAELNNADKRYKTLFENINGAVLLTTYEGQILEANHRSSDFFGYRFNEILCLSLKNLLPIDLDWSKFQEDIAAQGGLNIETYIICKDGSHLPVELSISLFNMEKKPVMFVLMWDITERKASEDRIKESEKKYHGLFQYSTDGILVLDSRGTIIDVNTKLCEMLACDKEKIVSNNLFNIELFTIKSLPSVVHQFEQLLSDKKAQYYTAKIKSKQDNLYIVEVSSFFLFKKDNEVDNFIIIIRDITGRNKTVKTRNIEQELFNTLLDNIPDSVYFKDEQNRYILINKIKAEQLNISRDEVINKTDFDLLPEDQARNNVEEDNNILKSGESILNKIEKITLSDGIEKWFSIKKFPRFNSNYEVNGTMGISSDITAQKNIEDDLVRAEERYKSIFNNSSFAIIQTDENELISSWNEMAEELLKMGYDQLYSKVIKDLFDEKEWDKIQSVNNQFDGNIPPIRTKINKMNGKTIEIGLSVSISKDNCGGLIGYSYIFNETT